MGEVKILEQTETGETEAPRPSKWLTYLIEGMILLLGLVLVVMLRVGVYEPAYIPSASMENTLKIGDRVLIDHRNSLHGKWKRGDIVLFEADENWGGGDTLIKRIVGLPGETVEMMNGQLFINGKIFNEDYLK
jgi:signal peptidase I